MKPASRLSMPKPAAVSRWLVAGFVLLGIIAVAWQLNSQHELPSFAALTHAFQTKMASQPLLVGALFALLYVAAAALSIPGAAILTLAAGALFGVLWGTIIVSFASTIGACLAFGISRWLLHDAVQARFSKPLSAINRGVEKEGGYYLFTLRLVPLFPFFMVNLLMGLSPIKLRTFYWVSQVGMFPATVIYVNAGAQASDISAVNDLLSPTLIASFVLLGVFPLVAKRLSDWFQGHRTEK